MEQLGNSRARPKARGVWAVRHGELKQESLGRVKLPFTKAIKAVKAVKAVTGTSPGKRNGDTSIGYWRPACLRREECDVAQNRNTGTKGAARQRLGKNVSAATNQHETIQEILEAVFSIPSLTRLYSMDHHKALVLGPRWVLGRKTDW
jgi:hypothetical protein